MEIREYYREEVIQFKKLCVPMFRAANPQLADEAAYTAALVREDQEMDEDFFRLGAFEDGKLWATIYANPYRVYLDGQEMKMSGIGGVVADFNPPRKGLVKDLFREGFRLMRERGQYVSHLYPFHANYYRQYGYEVSCKHHLWKIPVEYIPEDRSGKYYFYDGSDKMKQEIKTIYSQFARRYNLCIVKSDKMWEQFFLSLAPYTGSRFSYLHYTEGVADGFVSYRVVTNENRPQDLYADHLWFTDYRGLRGILSYFVTQRPYADRVLFHTPTNVELSACTEFQGGWAKRDTLCETANDGTSRVVDVEKVLEAVRYRGAGTVAIQIENDSYCPWNNDCFTVSFGEKTEVTRGGTPDIILDINAFSAMILGAVDLDDSLIFPTVRILRNRENLEKVFYKKNLYIDIHF